MSTLARLDSLPALVIVHPPDGLLVAVPTLGPDVSPRLFSVRASTIRVEAVEAPIPFRATLSM
jgi:hypothetical protein